MARTAVLYASLAALACSGTHTLDAGAEIDSGGTGDATAPVDTGSPDAWPIGPCAVDLDCDDGRYCNGLERCDPESPSATEDGCVPGLAPCVMGEVCVEASDTCRPDCVDPDRDGDGHDAEHCGGDDCDDASADTYFGAMERCDDRDNDCDGILDEGVSDDAWYGDCDGDGYPGPDGFALACPLPRAVPPGCTSPSGTWTLRSPAMGLDCDDTDSSIYPGAPDIEADGVDSDCDGREVCLLDADGDGFGGTMTIMSADADCSDPGEALGTMRDCCDTDERAFPGQTSYFFPPQTNCGNWDFNCDGVEERDVTTLYMPCASPLCMSEGWTEGRVLNCGESGTWMSCSCVTDTVSVRWQTCR